MSSVPPSHTHRLPLAGAEHLDRVCDRFEAAWTAGERPAIVEYLHPLTGSERAALARELIELDIYYRGLAGEVPQTSDYDALDPALDRDWLTQALAGREMPLSVAPPGYEVLRILGSGGMGIVYLARQVPLNRLVALKMTLGSVEAGPREQTRFRTEAEAVASLQHPNIVQIYEVGEWQGRPFLCLEYVSGGSLAQHLHGAPLPASTAAELLETLARAIHHAHERGILHRDLKPANVLLSKRDRRDAKDPRETPLRPLGPFGSLGQDVLPRITDFGLAKLLDDATGPTRSGDMLGTPSYMAPEQVQSRPGTTGPTTDVYGLGAILYELLTGRPPFLAETALETLLQVRTRDPVSPRQLQPNCPRDLVTICLKCLHKEPHKRYASAQALADDLHRFREGKPIQARPVSVAERALKWAWRHPATAVWIAVVVLLTVLGFSGVTWYAFHAEEQRRQAQAARDEAEANLYYQRVAGAYREWQACNLEAAERLLLPYQDRERQPWEWRYVRGLCDSDLLTLAGHPGPITSVVFSPDGSRVASASGTPNGRAPGEIRIWDSATGEVVNKFGETTAPIMSLAFHPEGQQLASASATLASGIADGVTLWDIRTGQPAATLARRLGGVFDVAFSPDGTLLATAGGDGRVRLWELASRREVALLSQHGGRAFRVAFSPDGQRLASVGGEGGVQIWDVPERRPLQLLPDLKAGRCVAFSPDGRYLAASSRDHTVEVWDTVRRRRQLTHAAHLSQVTSLAYRPDGFGLASADSTGLVQLYESLRPGEKRSLRGHTGTVYTAAFSPDGARLATGGWDGLVKLWDSTREQEFRGLRGQGGWVNSLAYNPDGRSLAAGAAAGGVRVCDIETGQIRQTLSGHVGGIAAVAYSADGTRLASAGMDKTVRLWDPAAGKHLLTLEGHVKAVNGIAFDPVGARLASASADETIRLWDLADGRHAHTLHGHTGSVTAVAFNPDGQLLASAGTDGTVKFWDARTGSLVRSLPAHEAPVTAVAFSPDGAWLASVGEDKRVALWETATGRERFRLLGHSRIVSAVAFSPEGDRLASASHDGTVKLWAVPTGAEVLTLRGSRGEVFSVAFRPDGHQLAAGAADSVWVRLWDAGPPRKRPERHEGN